VTVLGAARRKELLIYYMEDLATSGYTSDQLVVDSARRIVSDAWPRIAADVQRRALASIVVQRR
jgi:hypothetical protein